jgi:HD-like signal output (HDOD) protein
MVLKTAEATSAIPGSVVPDELRRTVESRLRDGRVELPVLPEIAQRVAAASRQDAADPRALAELIRRDPPLAANMLRLANSALYGGSVPIVSLQQAINRLGLERIRQIALAIACEGAVFAVPGHLAAVRSLFRHSLATATFAGEIARLRRRNVEEAYLAGLFHAVGRPVAMQLLVEIEATAGKPMDPAVFAAAAEEYHGPLGVLLRAHWKIAEPIQEALRHLCHPEQAASAAPLAMTVALAAEYARFALGDGTGADALRGHPLHTPLNLYPNDADRLLAQREAVVSLAGQVA